MRKRSGAALMAPRRGFPFSSTRRFWFSMAADAGDLTF